MKITWRMRAPDHFAEHMQLPARLHRCCCQGVVECNGFNQDSFGLEAPQTDRREGDSRQR